MGAKENAIAAVLRGVAAAEEERRQAKRVGQAMLIDGTKFRETGEVVPLDSLPFVARRKTKHPFGERWFAMNQNTIQKVATEWDLKAPTLRVWLYLLGRLDYENWLGITQKSVAEALSMHKVNVCQAFADLERRGMIARGERVEGGGFFWSLNEQDAWKGTVKNHAAAVRDRARRNGARLSVIEGGKAQDGHLDAWGGVARADEPARKPPARKAQAKRTEPDRAADQPDMFEGMD